MDEDARARTWMTSRIMCRGLLARPQSSSSDRPQARDRADAIVLFRDDPYLPRGRPH
jgi:hypothetical protein